MLRYEGKFIDSNTQDMFICSNTARRRGADAARIRPCVPTSEHVRGLRINEDVPGVRINEHVHKL